MTQTPEQQRPQPAMTERERADRAEVERDKLQAFKDYVHARLDAMGVPHHPPGPHGAEGCRVGDRFDWLAARSKGAETAEPESDMELLLRTFARIACRDAETADGCIWSCKAILRGIQEARDAR